VISRIELIFIVGPTAVGKSAVAVELAEKRSGEIISADSMQVYRGLDILSAKPSREYRRRIPHHLIDILDPRERCDVTHYCRLALAAIADIRGRRRIPLVVGGAGMYVRALIDGIFGGAGRDDEVRRRLDQEASGKGLDALHKRLKEADPIAALRIHPHDKRRIIRALEVYEICGRPISSFRKEWGSVVAGEAEGKGVCDSRNLGCRLVYMGLRREKDDLTRRIEERVERMCAGGAVDEVKKLFTLRADVPGTMWQSLGLKEIEGYLEGRYGIDEAKRLLTRETRAYAKRQYTWFTRDKRIRWFTVAPEETARETAEKLNAWISSLKSEVAAENCSG